MLEAVILPPRRHGALTVFPVVAEEDRDLPYRLMEDALESGILTIEGNENSTGPRLVARNEGSVPVLILNGEQLVGVGQSFMTSQSILLAPKGLTEFPVAAVEPDSASDGPEWERASRDDSGSGSDAHNPHLGRRTYTLSRHPEEDLAEWMEAFPIAEHQVGILAFLGPKFIGMDALGCPSIYAPLHPRLLAGYVLAARAVGQPDTDGPFPGEEEAVAFATALGEARRLPTQTVGLGSYSVFRGLVRGGELLHNDRLVHLSVFPLEPHEI